MTSSPFAPRAVRRARIATLGFVLAGFVGPWIMPHAAPLSGWLIAFYGMLVINGYFSIRCFASLHGASSALQRTIDAALFILYISLPLYFWSIRKFMALSSILFLVASIKYAYLLHHNEEKNLLARKIIIDNIGGTACLLIFMAAGTPYEKAALIGGVLATFLVNLYILWRKPLYVLSSKS